MLLERPSIGDAQQLAELHVRTWRATYAGIMEDDYLSALSQADIARRWEMRLERPEPRSVSVVARSDRGPIIGFVAAGVARVNLPGTDAEIIALNVLPEAQRSGVGATLICKVAEDLQDLGFQDVGLWVVEQNFRARAFYNRLGGRACEQHFRDFGKRAISEIAYRWDSLRKLKLVAASLLDR